MATDSPRALIKIAAVVAVVAILAIAHATGVLDHLKDPARLARSLVSLGGWGYLLFVVAYAALQPFGVPGTIFVVAAPLIWPWPVAFALSMTGTMAASVVGFSFARFLARDWFKARMTPQFRQYDDALEKRAFLTVAILRFVFWMPQLLHAFLGISKISGWTHFWGSLVGYAIPLFLVSFFGQHLFEVFSGFSLRTWLLVAGGTLTVGGFAWGLARFCARRAIAARSWASPRVGGGAGARRSSNDSTLSP